MENCPCGTGNDYKRCCQPFIKGENAAPTAVALMRSRYAAYVKKEVKYLTETLHPKSRHDHDEQAAKDWADKAEWLGLEINSNHGGEADDKEGTVEFTARYNWEGQERHHHEVSTFAKDEGRWYFVDGRVVGPKTVVRAAPKLGRNDLCTCGSGKKFKKCCGA